MAQSTDIFLSDQVGASFRTELNQILSAICTDNSGDSEPLNTYAYMKWLDTSNATYYYYKERNHDNTAWVTLFRYTVATKVMEAVSNGVVLQDSTLVHKTGDETKSGVMTFSSLPIINGKNAISQDTTAYNVDTTSFIANTLASGAIIERGSNANGEYTKYADGTGIGLINKTVTTSVSISNTYGLTSGVLYFNPDEITTFPLAFINIPNVLCNNAYPSAGPQARVSNVLATQGVIRVARNTNGTSIPVNIIMIGRWK